MIKYVDPMIGTVGDEQEKSMHGGGKTHPGACTPFGMVQLSPDTLSGGDNGTGYNYCNSTIEGFSFNHMSGIGWYGDLGNIQLMPTSVIEDLRSGTNMELPFTKGTVGWRSKFSHEREKAECGYYSVFLDRYGILCECTASTSVGMMRINYQKDGDRCLIFNFSRRIAGKADYQKINIVSPKKIEGEIICTPSGGGFGRGDGGIGYKLFFVIEMSEPLYNYEFFSNEEKKGAYSRFEGEDVGLFGCFHSDEVIVKCAISYESLTSAEKNMTNECNHFDFNRLKGEAQSLWENALGCVSVDGGDETDLTLFYTCLYHTMLDPRIHSDFYSTQCKSNNDKSSYPSVRRTMFSGWDVYRSQFPLLSITCPNVVYDTVMTLCDIALKSNSSLPRWELMGIDSRCMVGDPGLLVACDAISKGIIKHPSPIYDIGIKTAFGHGEGFDSVRPSCTQLSNCGYIPHNLSSTLEFLVADYALAQIAKRVGDEDSYNALMKRAMSYGDNYSNEYGFMSARDENGSFVPFEGEYSTYGCVESNIFQQSFFVPYDVTGLSELFGKERFITLLERLFEGAKLGELWNENYNHSNEPCHNLTHYFNLLGCPERTQYWTRRVQKEAYRLGAFGFCGNEDVGQLSAWYVLSAMGFAQICPCDNRYFINTPLFKSCKIKLNKQFHTMLVSDCFEIVCDKDPNDYPYIEAIILNGAKIKRTYLTYEEISSGGTLFVKLSKVPS